MVGSGITVSYTDCLWGLFVIKGEKLSPRSSHTLSHMNLVGASWRVYAILVDQGVVDGSLAPRVVRLSTTMHVGTDPGLIITGGHRTVMTLEARLSGCSCLLAESIDHFLKSVRVQRLNLLLPLGGRVWLSHALLIFEAALESIGKAHPIATGESLTILDVLSALWTATHCITVLSCVRRGSAFHFY